MGNRRCAVVILALAGMFLGVPEASAACSTPIAVGTVSATGTDFSATLTNPTNKAVKGYLGVAVTLRDGSTGLASIPVTVPAGGSTTTGASFPVEIEQIIDTEACDRVPWGITESPDPVIVIRPPEEESGNGNGNGEN